jgi:hypothetical protein
MKDLPAFRETGKGMLLAWKDGMDRLHSQKVYALGELPASATFEGISSPAKLPKTRAVIGRSPLLGGGKWS